MGYSTNYSMGYNYDMTQIRIYQLEKQLSSFFTGENHFDRKTINIEILWCPIWDTWGKKLGVRTGGP